MPWARTGAASTTDGTMTDQLEHAGVPQGAEVVRRDVASTRRRARSPATPCRRASSPTRTSSRSSPRASRATSSQPLVANPELQKRFRTSYNFRGRTASAALTTRLAARDGRELRQQGRRLDGAQVARRQPRSRRSTTSRPRGRLPTDRRRRAGGSGDRGAARTARSILTQPQTAEARLPVGGRPAALGAADGARGGARRHPTPADASRRRRRRPTTGWPSRRPAK